MENFCNAVFLCHIRKDSVKIYMNWKWITGGLLVT